MIALSKSVTNGVVRFITVLTLISSVCIIVMALATSIGTIGRVIGHPIPGIIELCTLLMAIIVFFAIARAQIMGKHPYVQAFTRFLPEGMQRVVQLVALLISLAFFVLLTWGSGIISWKSFLIREIYFGDIHFPVWITKMVIPIGSFSMCLYLMIQVTRAVRGLKGSIPK